jgi:glycosyltransferase involved in cell wall biosynthesis
MGLAQSGYQVCLLAPNKTATLAERFHVDGLPQIRGRYARLALGSMVALRAAIAREADIYHFHDPELIALGIVLKLLGRRVIYDAHEELAKQVLAKHWIPRSVRRPVSFVTGFVERMAARWFDGIVAATPAIAKNFPPNKTAVVHNYALPGEMEDQEGGPYAWRGPCVAYVGAICKERGLREAIDALELIDKQRPVRLLLAGSFRPPTLEQELRACEGWKHVEYWGQCNRGDVANLLGQARVGLVTLLPTPNHLWSHPIKLYEYMAAGLPVVASDFPLWRQIIESAGCGMLVNPESPEDIARAIHWLFDHPAEAEAMGRRGRKAVEEQFNWPSQLKLLLELYERVLRGCDGPPATEVRVEPPAGQQAA